MGEALNNAVFGSRQKENILLHKCGHVCCISDLKTTRKLCMEAE